MTVSPMCPYCHADVAAEDFTFHDIVLHNGLERTREDHALICERLGRCECRVDEYERVAQRIG